MSARLPGVLREEPAFRLLFASQVLSVLGDRITSLALPFAVLAVGGGLGGVALVAAAQFAPFVVLALPAGVWADRLDRRRIMMVSDVVRLATQVAAAVLLLTGRAEVWQLAALAAIFGAADAFFAPAFSGMLPTTVAAVHVQQANALRGLTFSLANVVGPALSGALIAFAGGPGAALLFDAATFAVSFALLARLRSPQVRRGVAVGTETLVDVAATTSFVTSLREGWAAVRSRGWVVAFLAGMACYHVVVLPSVFVLGPVLMRREYDGAASWALITALFGVGNILGDLLLVRWRPTRAMWVGALALIGCSTQAAIIGSGLAPLGIGLLELLTGVCVTLAFTLWETSLGEHVPEDSLSRVASYDYLVTAGLLPLGYVLAGAVGGAIGLHPALWGMGVVGVLVSVAVASRRSVRDLPRGAGATAGA